MPSTTTNYGFYKPDAGERGTWGAPVAGNFDTIDALLAAGAHGNLSSSGVLTLSGITSPSQITSDQANYNPTNNSSNTTLRINSDAARTIHGLVPPASSPAGTVKIIHNVGTFAITLADDSGTATAANRFRLSADIVLGADQSQMLLYDGSSSRWRAIGGVGGGSGGAGAAPSDAAYLIAGTSGVTGLTGEVLAGATPGGELQGAGSAWSAPAVSSVHGPEGLSHHIEEHDFFDDAIHENLTQADLLTFLDLDAAETFTPIVADVSLGNETKDMASWTPASVPDDSRWCIEYAMLGSNSDGSAHGLDVIFRVGTTNILTATCSIAASQTNISMTGRITFTFRSIGGSGTVTAAIQSVGEQNSPVAKSFVSSSPTTVDTTGALRLRMVGTSFISATLKQASLQRIA